MGGCQGICILTNSLSVPGNHRSAAGCECPFSTLLPLPPHKFSRPTFSFTPNGSFKNSFKNYLKNKTFILFRIGNICIWHIIEAQRGKSLPPSQPLPVSLPGGHQYDQCFLHILKGSSSNKTLHLYRKSRLIVPLDQ